MDKSSDLRFAPTMASDTTPFVFSMPVRFSDVDHAGIVYYPVFYHYFHVTFEEFFRDRLGLDAYVKLLDVDKIGFPAVHTECEYKAPLRFGETVEVEMTTARLGNRSIQVRYRAYRRRAASAERDLAAVGLVTSAVVDLAEFRATVTPEPIRRLFLDICEQDTAVAD